MTTHQSPELSRHVPVNLDGWMGRLRAGWENSPAAVVVTAGAEHVIVFQNAASRALFGSRQLQTPMAEAFPETVTADLDQVWQQGTVRVRNRRPVGLRDPQDLPLHLSYVVTRIVDDDGAPLGLVISAVDLSGAVRAELTANRTALLARVTDRMTAASGPVPALQRLTDTLVPELADVAGVYLLTHDQQPDPFGRPHRNSTARWADPVALTVSADLERLGPPPRLTPRPLAPAAWQHARGPVRPVLLDLGAASSGLVDDPHTRAWLVRARAHNLAVIPLSEHGRPTGLLAVLAAGERQPYGEPILPFLTDVAARAGVALAQARLHHVQAHTAHRLQQALLPAAPPLMPGVRIAASYLPGAADVDVGGDWWDAQRIDGTHLALGVGDASGRGVEAAIMMGQARAAIRTAVLAGLSPARVLNLVDRQLHDVITHAERGGRQVPQFVTAVHAVMDTVTGQITAANAGHLPLLLLRPGETTARTVHVSPGPPLGVGLGGYTETTIDLPRGGGLLMFTDGLVEGSRDFASGIHLLATELSAQADTDADTALARILTALGAGHRRHPPGRDDIAALLLRREDHRRSDPPDRPADPPAGTDTGPQR